MVCHREWDLYHSPICSISNSHKIKALLTTRRWNIFVTYRQSLKKLDRTSITHLVIWMRLKISNFLLLVSKRLWNQMKMCAWFLPKRQYCLLWLAKCLSQKLLTRPHTTQRSKHEKHFNATMLRESLQIMRPSTFCLMWSHEKKFHKVSIWPPIKNNSSKTAKGWKPLELHFRMKHKCQ